MSQNNESTGILDARLFGSVLTVRDTLVAVGAGLCAGVVTHYAVKGINALVSDDTSVLNAFSDTSLID